MEELVGAAVKIVRGDDLIAHPGNGEQREGFRRLT